MNGRRARYIPVEGGEPNDRLPMFTFTGEGESIEGQYIQRRENVGPHGSSVYVLQRPSGLIGVWGSAVLDSKFGHLRIGSVVYIEYLGEVLSQRGTTYKNYFVGIEESVAAG